MTYARLYDGYWRQADRMRSHGFDPEPIADAVLTAFGSGRALDAGGGMGLLAATLLRRGVDAYGVDVSQVAVRAASARAPGRFCAADLRRLPFGRDRFDWIVSTDCLDHVAEEHVPAVLAELRRVARRGLFLRVATRADRDGRWQLTLRPREWWEAHLFEAGFRKHPAYYEINTYESLGQDGVDITLVMEKIDDAALAGFPLDRLKDTRDLHMDMLRESGVRSDAHVERYRLASSSVRPGDVVLDAACGLGYGAYVVHSRTMAARTIGIDGSAAAIEYARSNFAHAIENLTFEQGDLPATLRALADDSIDVVLSFETLEHVVDPRALVREFTRVLKPSGRLIVSVPNDWSDETGKDPNPNHLHVYTWPKLADDLQAPLILDAVHAQTASRCKSRDDAGQWQTAGRSLVSIPLARLEPEALPECEWWIATAMKDPRLGAGVPYRETTFDAPFSANWNPTAFARDYRNPWLVKGMVTIGHRLSDANALLQLAERVHGEAPAAAADNGAALTVIAYRRLADRDLSARDVEVVERLSEPYLSAAAPLNPHQKRWRISLLFVLGRLWQAVGDFGRATECFEGCATLDPLEFSPLLATKPIAACIQLALLAAAVGEHDRCAEQLRRAIAMAERALKTDWNAALGDVRGPIEFALPELATVMEYASSAGYALAHLDEVARRPATWWWQHQRDHLTQMARLERVVAEQGVASREIHRLHEVLAVKDSVVSKGVEEIHRLNDVVAKKDAALAEVIAEVRRLDGVVERNEAALADTQGEIRRLNNVVERKEAALADTMGEIGRLNERVAEADRARVQAEQTLDETTRRATGAESALAAIRASKWNQLGDALRQGPNGLPRVGRLGTQMIAARVRRMYARTPQRDVGGRQSIAYVVKRPRISTPEPQRVVHVLANFMTGGSSRLVVDLVEHLGDRYDQRIVTSHVPSPPAYVGVDVAEIHLDAPDSAFVAALTQPGVDLIHVHYWGDCDEPWYRRVFDAARQAGCPVLENVNTPVAPFRSPLVARYVFVSDYVKDHFGSGDDNEEVIRPGSDFSMFRPQARRADPDTIGMVYRLERDKLDEASIDPLIEVVRRRPHARAIVVGGGTLLDSFRRRAEIAGVAARFEFTGYVAYEALPAIYAKFAVFVAPVWNESFGQVSPFAMSMGIPVCGYAAGAIPEIVDDPALCAPRGDSEALANIVIGLLDDPVRRASIAARQQARARRLYSVEAMVRRYREVYEALLTAAP